MACYSKILYKDRDDYVSGKFLYGWPGLAFDIGWLDQLAKEY